MDSFAQQKNEETNEELELNNAQEVSEEGSSSECNIDSVFQGLQVYQLTVISILIYLA